MGFPLDLTRWREEPPPLPGGMYRVLQESFRGDPGKAALQTPDGPTITYGQLLDLVELGRLRLAELGVTPGDRVLVYVEKTVAAVLLYLACLSRGAVFVPVNPDYTLPEVLRLIGDARPRLVVCDPGRQDALWATAPEARIGVLQSDGLVALSPVPAESTAVVEATAPGGDDPAVVLYTSGTTGTPRGVVLSHRAVLANGLALCRAWGFGAQDILVHALPLYHTHGLLVALNCALISGASIMFMSEFDPEATIGLLGRATVFMGVPTHYTRLLTQSALSPGAVAGMRLFTCGSAPLLPQVWEQFHRRSGHRIVERYGMTEVGILTSNPCPSDAGPRQPVAGTVGFPLQGVSIKVVDADGHPVDQGTVGELCAQTPGAMSGYVNKPPDGFGTKGTRGWFRTGDLASVDQEGRVTLRGRLKDLVITGGLNVHPLEVETVLNARPEVAESAVFGVPHPDFGEGVAAAVVTAGPRPPAPAPLRQALSATLAGYKIPKRFVMVDSLPRNPMGKVQKQVLRSRYARIFDRQE